MDGADASLLERALEGEIEIRCINADKGIRTQGQRAPTHRAADPQQTR